MNETANFKQRILIHLVDSGLMFGCLYILYPFFEKMSFVYTTFLPLLFFWIIWIFSLSYLVHKYGGTPACLILGYRIFTKLGQNISFNRALIRHFYWWIRLSFDLYLIHLLIINIPTNILFISKAGLLELKQVYSPWVYSLSRQFFLTFFIFDLGVILLNAHSRSFVDFISDTYVVVYK